MALDLTKIVYNKLEDGAYDIKPISWSVKQTTKSEDYVALSCIIPMLNDRPVSINLFEKGLDITASNVSTYLNLEELSLVEVLDSLVNKIVPAFHQTVEQDGKTYYNWYICSAPRVSVDDPNAF